jgi:hypothetical protein
MSQEEVKIEKNNENQNQQPEAGGKPTVDDPVLKRLLEQERELEKLRRYNERLRKVIQKRKAEVKAAEEKPAPEPALTQTRHTYASRFYNLLRRDYGD